MPRKAIEQQAAHQRSERHAEGTHGRPHSDGDGAFLRIGEDAANHGDSDGHDGGTADTQQGTQSNELLGVFHQQRASRYTAEDQKAHKQHALSSEAIGKRAGCHDKARQDKRIGIDDPKQLFRSRFQVFRDIRQCDVEHRKVDGNDELPQ